MLAGVAGSAAASLPITPTFVLPYKRFATPCLLELARGYLERDRQTYRQATRSGGLPAWYERTTGGTKGILRALHLATLWQFLTWLGSQTAALEAGLSLLNQHDPANGLHRFAGAVAPHKYRSPERRDLLATARRLLHLIDCWDRTFKERFFPRFATRSGVP